MTEQNITHCTGSEMDEELNLIKNITIEVQGIIGRVRIPLEEVLQLGEGSVVELDSEVGDDAEILINGKRIARAEIVAVGNQYGLRLSKIIAK
ncbi:MAG: FliM/FliN family flagellar motor switch protein [Dethiobacter sp.]|nr:FliM/FliN family flagellar motor switch protein [Dethiobacter sp.]